MKNMGAADWARAREEMARLSPEELARQAGAATATMSAQQQYAYNVRRAPLPLSPSPLSPSLSLCPLASPHAPKQPRREPSASLLSP